MNTFPKCEHLCSEKLLDELFHQGRRAMVYPLSIHWMYVPAGTLPQNVQAQVLIATSKKKFRHAVDRNRVKRLMRECYRLHKSTVTELLQKRHYTMVIGINYIHNEIFDYQHLYHKFDKLTSILIEDIRRQPSNLTAPCHTTSES